MGGCSWQKDLVHKGFSVSLINKLILHGLLKREKRSLEQSKFLSQSSHSIEEKKLLY